MEASENSIKLYYNTEVEKLQMPEYGRNVLQMVEQLRDIPDKAKRTEQAYAVVKVMESLNPQVHQQENFGLRPGRRCSFPQTHPGGGEQPSGSHSA